MKDHLFVKLKGHESMMLTFFNDQRIWRKKNSSNNKTTLSDLLLKSELFR